MADITRDKFIPMIDIADNEGSGPHTANYVPIDLSTVFELVYNAQTETYGYICYANDVTEINGYQPSMEQQIRIDGTNPLYKWMLPYMRSMPTGSDAVRPVLIVYPDLTTGEATDGDLFPEAKVIPGTINSVDHILTFTLSLDGNRQPGTVAKTGSSVTFTPDSEDDGE